jgi:hypothetical protein
LTVTTLRVEQLLWKTRGLHWDYEFIAIPDEPVVMGWTKALDELLGHEAPEASRLLYGELDVLPKLGSHDKSFAFVATRFFDPVKSDWTGRRVQHFALWLRDTEDLLTLAEDTPIDWHVQALRGLEAAYGGAEVFGMDEQRVRDWRKTHPEQTRAEYVLARIRQTAPMSLYGPTDASTWSRARKLQVKKKPATGADSTVRSVSARRRRGSRTAMVLLAIAAVLVGVGLTSARQGGWRGYRARLGRRVRAAIRGA